MKTNNIPNKTPRSTPQAYEFGNETLFNSQTYGAD